MMRSRTALMMFAMSGIWFGTAHAAPPTVTPSPGYDARLQEQRSAHSAHGSLARDLERPRPGRGKKQHGKAH